MWLLIVDGKTKGSIHLVEGGISVLKMDLLFFQRTDEIEPIEPKLEPLPVQMQEVRSNVPYLCNACLVKT